MALTASACFDLAASPSALSSATLLLFTFLFFLAPWYPLPLHPPSSLLSRFIPISYCFEILPCPPSVFKPYSFPTFHTSHLELRFHHVYY